MEMIGIYPACVLKNSQVFSISCGTLTLRLFQWGLGILLKAYGPANGGLVNVFNTLGGPRSVLTVVNLYFRSSYDLNFLFDFSFRIAKSELGDTSAAVKLIIRSQIIVNITSKMSERY